jgi:hypothetical protein
MSSRGKKSTPKLHTSTSSQKPSHSLISSRGSISGVSSPSSSLSSSSDDDGIGTKRENILLGIQQQITEKFETIFEDEDDTQHHSKHIRTLSRVLFNAYLEGESDNPGDDEIDAFAFNYVLEAYLRLTSQLFIVDMKSPLYRKLFSFFPTFWASMSNDIATLCPRGDVWDDEEYYNKTVYTIQMSCADSFIIFITRELNQAQAKHHKLIGLNILHSYFRELDGKFSMSQEASLVITMALTNRLLDKTLEVKKAALSMVIPLLINPQIFDAVRYLAVTDPDPSIRAQALFIMYKPAFISQSRKSNDQRDLDTLIFISRMHDSDPKVRSVLMTLFEEHELRITPYDPVKAKKKKGGDHGRGHGEFIGEDLEALQSINNMNVYKTYGQFFQCNYHDTQRSKLNYKQKVWVLKQGLSDPDVRIVWQTMNIISKLFCCHNFNLVDFVLYLSSGQSVRPIISPGYVPHSDELTPKKHSEVLILAGNQIYSNEHTQGRKLWTKFLSNLESTTKVSLGSNAQNGLSANSFNQLSSQDVSKSLDPLSIFLNTVSGHGDVTNSVHHDLVIVLSYIVCSYSWVHVIDDGQRHERHLYKRKRRVPNFGQREMVIDSDSSGIDREGSGDSVENDNDNDDVDVDDDIFSLLQRNDDQKTPNQGHNKDTDSDTDGDDSNDQNHFEDNNPKRVKKEPKLSKKPSQTPPDSLDPSSTTNIPPNSTTRQPTNTHTLLNNAGSWDETFHSHKYQTMALNSRQVVLPIPKFNDRLQNTIEYLQQVDYEFKMTQYNEYMELYQANPGQYYLPDEPQQPIINLEDGCDRSAGILPTGLSLLWYLLLSSLIGPGNNGVIELLKQQEFLPNKYINLNNFIDSRPVLSCPGYNNNPKIIFELMDTDYVSDLLPDLEALSLLIVHANAFDSGSLVIHALLIAYHVDFSRCTLLSLQSIMESLFGLLQAESSFIQPLPLTLLLIRTIQPSFVIKFYTLQSHIQIGLVDDDPEAMRIQPSDLNYYVLCIEFISGSLHRAISHDRFIQSYRDPETKEIVSHHITLTEYLHYEQQYQAYLDQLEIYWAHKSSDDGAIDVESVSTLPKRPPWLKSPYARRQGDVQGALQALSAYNRTIQSKNSHLSESELQARASSLSDRRSTFNRYRNEYYKETYQFESLIKGALIFMTDFLTNCPILEPQTLRKIPQEYQQFYRQLHISVTEDELNSILISNIYPLLGVCPFIYQPERIHPETGLVMTDEEIIGLGANIEDFNPIPLMVGLDFYSVDLISLLMNIITQSAIVSTNRHVVQFALQYLLTFVSTLPNDTDAQNPLEYRPYHTQPSQVIDSSPDKGLREIDHVRTGVNNTQRAKIVYSTNIYTHRSIPTSLPHTPPHTKFFDHITSPSHMFIHPVFQLLAVKGISDILMNFYNLISLTTGQHSFDRLSDEFAHNYQPRQNHLNTLGTEGVLDELKAKKFDKKWKEFQHNSTLADQLIESRKISREKNLLNTIPQELVLNCYYSLLGYSQSYINSNSELSISSLNVFQIFPFLEIEKCIGNIFTSTTMFQQASGSLLSPFTIIHADDDDDVQVIDSSDDDDDDGNEDDGYVDPYKSDIFRQGAALVQDKAKMSNKMKSQMYSFAQNKNFNFLQNSTKKLISSVYSLVSDMLEVGSFYTPIDLLQSFIHFSNSNKFTLGVSHCGDVFTISPLRDSYNPLSQYQVLPHDKESDLIPNHVESTASLLKNRDTHHRLVEIFNPTLQTTFENRQTEQWEAYYTDKEFNDNFGSPEVKTDKVKIGRNEILLTKNIFDLFLQEDITLLFTSTLPKIDQKTREESDPYSNLPNYDPNKPNQRYKKVQDHAMSLATPYELLPYSQYNNGYLITRHLEDLLIKGDFFFTENDENVENIDKRNRRAKKSLQRQQLFLKTTMASRKRCYSTLYPVDYTLEHLKLYQNTYISAIFNQIHSTAIFSLCKLVFFNHVPYSLIQQSLSNLLISSVVTVKKRTPTMTTTKTMSHYQQEIHDTIRLFFNCYINLKSPITFNQFNGNFLYTLHLYQNIAKKVAFKKFRQSQLTESSPDSTPRIDLFKYQYRSYNAPKPGEDPSEVDNSLTIEDIDVNNIPTLLHLRYNPLLRQQLWLSLSSKQRDFFCSQSSLSFNSADWSLSSGVSVCDHPAMLASTAPSVIFSILAQFSKVQTLAMIPAYIDYVTMLLSPHAHPAGSVIPLDMSKVPTNSQIHVNISIQHAVYSPLSASVSPLVKFGYDLLTLVKAGVFQDYFRALFGIVFVIVDAIAQWIILPVDFYPIFYGNSEQIEAKNQHEDALYAELFPASKDFQNEPKKSPTSLTDTHLLEHCLASPSRRAAVGFYLFLSQVFEVYRLFKNNDPALDSQISAALHRNQRPNQGEDVTLLRRWVASYKKSIERIEDLVSKLIYFLSITRAKSSNPPPPKRSKKRSQNKHKSQQSQNESDNDNSDQDDGDDDDYDYDDSLIPYTDPLIPLLNKSNILKQNQSLLTETLKSFHYPYSFDTFYLHQIIANHQDDRSYRLDSILTLGLSTEELSTISTQDKQKQQGLAGGSVLIVDNSIENFLQNIMEQRSKIVEELAEKIPKNVWLRHKIRFKPREKSRSVPPVKISQNEVVISD